jgi:nucleotide-binding universal stress UspA family protein
VDLHRLDVQATWKRKCVENSTGLNDKERKMFKHILIPTDGSALGNKAVKAGMKLARELGARVTGYYAMESIEPAIYGEGYVLNARVFSDLEQRAKDVGKQRVAEMAKIAAAAGVPFKGISARASTPYEGIIAQAKKNECDAIFMASHGRRGIAAVLLGSVTHQVLTHSKLPVLVYR